MNRFGKSRWVNCCGTGAVHVTCTCLELGGEAGSRGSLHQFPGSWVRAPNYESVHISCLVCWRGEVFVSHCVVLYSYTSVCPHSTSLVSRGLLGHRCASIPYNILEDIYYCVLVYQP